MLQCNILPVSYYSRVPTCREENNISPPKHNANSGSHAKLAARSALTIILLVALFAAARLLIPAETLAAWLRLIETAGTPGLLFFLGLYVMACIFMLPGTILTLGAGAVFGVIRGFILVSVSSTAGATAAFLIGRHFARGMITRRFADNSTFHDIDKAVAEEGWKIVLLSRLSPVFPFNLLNYAFGLTPVPLRDYVISSWIGMMPGTLMYVYIGSLGGNLARLGINGSERIRTPAEWVLFFAGLVATVAVAVMVTRIARKALSIRIRPGEGSEEYGS